MVDLLLLTFQTANNFELSMISGCIYGNTGHVTFSRATSPRQPITCYLFSHTPTHVPPSPRDLIPSPLFTPFLIYFSLYLLSSFSQISLTNSSSPLLLTFLHAFPIFIIPINLAFFHFLSSCSHFLG